VDFSGLDHPRKNHGSSRDRLVDPNFGALVGAPFFCPAPGPSNIFGKDKNPSNNNAFRPRHLRLQFAIGARRTRRAEMMAMVYGYGRNQIMQRTHS
jgi:hypothetical protein